MLKRVRGTQGQDGTVNPLNEQDIQACIRLKFRYITPENLNLVQSNDSKKFDNIKKLIEDMNEEEN